MAFRFQAPMFWQTLPRLLIFGILASACAQHGRPDLFALSAAFAVLVAYPLALHLDTTTPRFLHKLAIIAGTGVAVSMLIPRGPLAGVLAASWCLFAIPNLIYGLIRFLNTRDKRDACVWAEAASVTGPVVGAAALVCSRTGGDFAGFPEPLAILTVTHFHFTFGLLPAALAALTRRFRGEAPAGFAVRAAAMALGGIVFIPPAIGLFFMLRSEKLTPSPAEAAATVLLALAVAAWAHFAFWNFARKIPVTDAFAMRAGAILLTVATAAGAWFCVMTAIGEATASYGIMLRTHGVANAVATLIITFVALRHAARPGLASPAPTPDPLAPETDMDAAKAIFRDDRTLDLGPETPGRFEAMRVALLAYRFYPDSVMVSASAFKTEKRPARPGDRIGMALCVPLFPGLPPVYFPATTVVNLVTDTPDEVALGYVTTRAHYGRGAWSATLARADGRITVRIRSYMTPTHPLAVAGLPFYRFLQKRAHRTGAENLGNCQA